MTDIQSLSRYYDESLPPSLWDGGGDGGTPVLTSIDPPQVPIEFVGTLTFNGTGFAAPMSVYFGNDLFSAVDVVSPTQATVQFTATAYGEGPYLVRLTGTNELPFLITGDALTLSGALAASTEPQSDESSDGPSETPTAPDDGADDGTEGVAG